MTPAEKAPVPASKFTAEEIAAAVAALPSTLVRGFEGRAKIEEKDYFQFIPSQWSAKKFETNEYWGADLEVFREDGSSKGIMTVSLGGLCRIATALDGNKVGEDNPLIALCNAKDCKDVWAYLCENHMEDYLVCTKVTKVETDFGPQKVRSFTIS